MLGPCDEMRWGEIAIVAGVGCLCRVCLCCGRSLVFSLRGTGVGMRDRTRDGKWKDCESRVDEGWGGREGMGV